MSYELGVSAVWARDFEADILPAYDQATATGKGNPLSTVLDKYINAKHWLPTSRFLHMDPLANFAKELQMLMVYVDADDELKPLGWPDIGWGFAVGTGWDIVHLIGDCYGLKMVRDGLVTRAESWISKLVFGERDLPFGWFGYDHLAGYISNGCISKFLPKLESLQMPNEWPEVWVCNVQNRESVRSGPPLPSSEFLCYPWTEGFPTRTPVEALAEGEESLQKLKKLYHLAKARGLGIVLYMLT